MLIAGKDLNPFVNAITNVNATIRTESYSTRTTKLTISRSLGAKTMDVITIFFKDGYTIIASISYYNEAIQISGKTKWSILYRL